MKKTLVLLVGSNPLPNYLTAMALQPDRVVLVYSAQTTEPKERLREVLKGKRPQMVLEDECVEATDAKKIFDKLKSAFEKWQKLGDEVLLNYTGGTKTMAAHARMAFAECGLPAGNASYLDERAAAIRFDDSRPALPLTEVTHGLTMDVALSLHGATWKSTPRVSFPGDSQRLAEAVLVEHAENPLRGPKLAARLYSLQRKDGKALPVTEAKREPKRMSALGLSLSVDAFPAEGWASRQFNEYRDFLDGFWFEEWVEQIVRATTDGDVHFNVECTRAGRSFELDVVIVRGHQVYVMSCTTDATPDRCKSKLFEVATRATQIGGELARSALVCLLWDKDNNGSFIDQVRADVASLWEPTNAPKVFGFEDVRRWLGQPESGQAADTSELAKWLES